MFNALTLGLSSEARGLTVHCGILHGHNVYSLGLVLVTGKSVLENEIEEHHLPSTYSAAEMTVLK